MFLTVRGIGQKLSYLRAVFVFKREEFHANFDHSLKWIAINSAENITISST
jgi:hypothetical protein